MILKKNIGLFQLILISVSAIVSLKSLPLFSEMGFSILFFLILATFLFFIPTALAIAELSYLFPNEGGCYFWIKKAYGKSFGFLVIWAYWMESIIWFPTMLIFLIAMLSNSLSLFFPNLEGNIYFLVFGMIFVFWFLTFVNFLGIKLSAFLSSFGVFFGTIFPVFIIIIFGFYYFFFIPDLKIDFSFNSFIPSFEFNNLVFFSGILLGLSGIEIISFYVKDVKNPKSNISKAVIISSLLIILIYFFGSISISMVIPKSEICFASGVVQALNVFFLKFGFQSYVPLISFFLLIGSLSGMNTWIIAPANGLFVAAKDGFLPNFFCKVNSKGVPCNLLILQAFIGTFLSIVFFLYIKNINGFVWIFVCLSFQFASFVYIMIFLSVLKLNKKNKIYNKNKTYFLKFFYFLGIFMCIFTFLISYIQPMDINVGKNLFSFLLFFSFLLLFLPAFILIFFKKSF